MVINRIELNGVLPLAFADEREVRSKSDIWVTDHVAFERGRRYLVASASGGGKSSLCSFIYGERGDFSGSILFDGENISAFKESNWNAIRREVLAWLPQDMRLFPTLTVIENVMLKASMTGFKSEADVRQMLAAVDLERFADRLAAHLSIGQQQRVAAVRALCQPFSFILLDEPVSHLDEASNQALSSLIKNEASKQGAGIIVTSVGNNPLIEPDMVYNL